MARDNAQPPEADTANTAYVYNHASSASGAGRPAVPAELQAPKKTVSKNDVGKEKARQRDRAVSRIKKYGGTYAKEGQKTKWIVDMVMKIDEEYKHDVINQRQQIASLQQQLQSLQEKSSRDMQQMQQQVDTQEFRLQELQLELYNTTYALQTAQAQHAVMQESLRYAEDAAAVSTSECATLAAAVQAMTEQDARARSSLAHRAHHLKEALLQTSSALRQFNDRDRRDRNEKEQRLREKEKALLAERQALLEQQTAQHARDAALETLQLKYHLAAMKIKELRDSKGAQDAASSGVVAGVGSDQTPAGAPKPRQARIPVKV